MKRFYFCRKVQISLMSSRFAIISPKMRAFPSCYTQKSERKFDDRPIDLVFFFFTYILLSVSLSFSFIMIIIDYKRFLIKSPPPKKKKNEVWSPRSSSLRHNGSSETKLVRKIAKFANCYKFQANVVPKQIPSVIQCPHLLRTSDQGKREISSGRQLVRLYFSCVGSVYLKDFCQSQVKFHEESC